MAACASQGKTEHRQEQKWNVFLFCNVMFFLLPREIWRQTYSWVAGFANYSVSAVFLLVWVREIGLAFSRKAEDCDAGLLELLLCFAGSFLVQMFLENLAIFTVMLSIFLCAVQGFRNKKVPMKNILMLVGAVLGLLIMFSSRIYGSLWSTGEAVNGYRSLSVGTQYSFMTTIYMLLSQAALLAPLIFEKNTVQCLVILGMLSILLLRKEQGKGYAYVLCAVNGLFVMYILYSFLTGNTAAQFGGFFSLVLNGMLFLTVAVETVLLFRGNRSVLGTALTIWASVPGVILPLVFTLEVGERLFLTSNVFMTLFAAMLLMELTEQRCLKRVKVICLVGALLLMGFHGYIYHEIGACKRERDGLMAQAAMENAESVTLPRYPHEEYLWGPNPVGEKRQRLFRTFYHLPDNIEIHIP